MAEYEAIHLVLQYMTMGHVKLLNAQPKNKETLDGAVIKKYLSQIVDPILLFHQRRVLHRDLKPADLLIDGNGDNKVADFGLCHPFAEAVRLFTHNVGTL
ncbi:hypothetical protein HPB51_008071 [Rhipicephalus microplus]|uniref:Protein kinase domain-containing protein n=1 Tax=Rhipicephalus microplus TaxID=6941 RepID=A0A9J6EFY3_RHIMP|nr:hypothetical protein HPB51_008071 [Rhipicephalus microplus]